MKLLFASFLIFLLPHGNALAASAAIRMATTTSTQNSGLLAQLLPRFEQQSGIQIQVIAVGTGKALKMGRDGDVDLVMVHAPIAEEQFVKEGHGIARLQFMYNQFLLVGPVDDPAQIASATSALQALQRIAATQSLFISRGDDSGTHKRELAIWRHANIEPQGSWYRQAGQGMGKVLQMASELDAYTLTDGGTWLAQREKLHLTALYQGDQTLRNSYGAIAVNPQHHPHVQYAAAKQMIDWLGGAEAQRLIADYKIGGQPLFTPLLLESTAPHE